MKKIAIIGGGYMAGIFAINAREMNIETHCFSLRDGIKNPDAFDFIHEANILDKESVLDECKRIGINGVVATTELTIATCAFVAESMALNGMPFRVANVITDKYRNRSIATNVEGLYQPRYAIVNSINELLSTGFNYPMILKPTSKGGKRGITVIMNESEVENAFEYAVNDGGKGSPLIIEEYIDGGIECSVESLSYHGNNYIIQITEKITSGPPHCVELAHHQPARIDAELRNRVQKVISEALCVIGITNGPCHTEIKIKDNRIYLIEFNARPGGDHIAYPLTQLSTGFEYIKGAIKIALNENPNIRYDSFHNKYSGVVFISEQTRKFLPLFEACESYPWFYKKNVIGTDLKSIQHNDGFNNNYFIYCWDKRPSFLN